MNDVNAGVGQGRRREVLRQAAVALDNRVVTLWEVSAQAHVVPVLTSVPDPPPQETALDLDATLHRWGTSIIQGSRWVGCRLDGDGTRWCLAPVRVQPAAPPPHGVERRSRERITLELAGLCLGLIDGGPGTRVDRLPESAALLELSRHPSVIAHEVASPLTAALVATDASIELVRDATELAAPLRAQLLRELADVAEGVERAVGYLRAIQEHARGVLARSERFDAVKVVRSCVTLERPLARRRGIELQWESALESVYLQGDANGLYQIVVNLIRNAVDASIESSAPVTIGVARAGNVLRLTVLDRGVGIAGEHLERIFEPGFTTKAFGSGSGMGLVVVREVTRNMFNGSVSVESKLGEGSRFTIAFPIPPQRHPAPQR